MNLTDYDWINIDGNYVHHTAQIAKGVLMGKGNCILPYAVIGYPGAIRDVKEYEGKVVIGDNNYIGSHVSITTGADMTKIGSRNIIMNKVNIGHDCFIGNHNEIGAGTIIAGHVCIANSNKIKISCCIRNRVQIGSHNIIGQGSNVVENIEDQVFGFGNPFKGQKQTNGTL